MSIHELSVRFAAYLAQELDSNNQQEQRMAYGLEILLGEIIKLLTIVLFSWLLGILAEVLIITISAGILRLASGGEHCSEYYRCLIGGTVWFLLLGWGVSIINNIFNQATINITVGLLFLIAFVMILKYAPGETENKPINSRDEKKKFKKWSIVIMVIYIFVILLTVTQSVLNNHTIAVAIGIMAQAFTVTPYGYKFIHFIDRVLDFSGVKI